MMSIHVFQRNNPHFFQPTTPKLPCTTALDSISVEVGGSAVLLTTTGITLTGSGVVVLVVGTVAESTDMMIRVRFSLTEQSDVPQPSSQKHTSSLVHTYINKY